MPHKMDVSPKSDPRCSSVVRAPLAAPANVRASKSVTIPASLVDLSGHDFSRAANAPKKKTALRVTEKSKKAVIPSAARDPSWFTPAKRGILRRFASRNDGVFDFFRNLFSR
jgi:hypothetical protein